MAREESKSQVSVNSYKDLLVWQRSHNVAIFLYKLSSKKKKSFSDIEIWKQVLSAAFSVPANIAEGFHSHRGKSYASHLEIARGSMGEVDYWLTVLVETAQVSGDDAKFLGGESQEVIAMLTAIIRKIR